MIYGRDSLIKDFKRLADNRELFHSYLFFGEPQTGKFLFAEYLANYIETKKFSKPEKILNETLIVDFSDNSGDFQNNKESVGIDAVREVERFLYKTAVSSPYRIVIIRDAKWLTDQAQNALLKIVESPPKNSLIIITAKDKADFLPTLVSRMQSIYFKTLPESMILDFLVKYGKIGENEAKSIAKKSYGRIGRAVMLSQDDKSSKEISLAIKNFTNKKNSEKRALENIVDDLLKMFEKSPESLDVFFKEIVEKVRPFFKKEPKLCKNINQEIARMESLAVNKRIHIKNILWTTKSILSDS